MIWKKWETVQRFATTTQALSVKRTGFSRQPSHIKVTSGCQGDRLFEEKILLKFFWGSSQERRISSLDSRMANKVKFVCHWILESWPLLPRAHFALFCFLGYRIWKENWSRHSELDPFLFSPSVLSGSFGCWLCVFRRAFGKFHVVIKLAI
jgi:hypothetical protein